jgi:hypothetical protein
MTWVKRQRVRGDAAWGAPSPRFVCLDLRQGAIGVAP